MSGFVTQAGTDQKIQKWEGETEKLSSLDRYADNVILPAI